MSAPQERRLTPDDGRDAACTAPTHTPPLSVSLEREGGREAGRQGGEDGMVVGGVQRNTHSFYWC